MKTSFRTFALAAAFTTVFAFNSFADDKEAKKTAFGTGIYASKTGRVHINIDKYVNENTTVTLTNKAGKLMYREMIGKDVNKFRTTLNVNDLPSGTYQIEISSKSGKEVKTFELSDKVAEREISVK